MTGPLDPHERARAAARRAGLIPATFDSHQLARDAAIAGGLIPAPMLDPHERMRSAARRAGLIPPEVERAPVIDGPRVHVAAVELSTSQRAYVDKAFAGELAALDAAGEGGRNDTLNRCAFNVATLVGAGAIPEDVARDRLTTAALRIGLTEHETALTIASAFRKGMAKPRVLPEPQEPRGELARVYPPGACPEPAHGCTAPADVDPADDVQPWDTVVPVDWHELFARDPGAEPEWLAEPMIERGRSTALYAPQKAGKSLLALELVGAIAAGRPVLGNAARPPVDVVYLDFENSPDDLYERLVDFGYGPDDLSRLHYYSFPDLDTLDTAAGGAQVMALVERHAAALVVVDTTSRVIAGEENSADTFRALYRHTFLRLKRAGIAAVRLDHSGKVPGQGQRGSSAKGDDVDYVWALTSHGGGRVMVKREASRTRHGADRLDLTRRPAGESGHLRHVVAGVLDVDPVDGVVVQLDRLGVPGNAGRDTAGRALRHVAYRVSTDHLAAAVARRKSRPGAENLSGTGPEASHGGRTLEPVRAPLDSLDVPAGETCPGQLPDRSGQVPPVHHDDLSALAPRRSRGQADSVGAPTGDGDA